MAWYMGSVRVFVQGHDGTNKQIIPRLQPLSGGTVYQVFGYEKKTTKIEAIIVGDADLATLQGYTITGSYYELTGPEGSLGNYLVSSVQYKREKVVYQTIRTDLDCAAPVYTVNLELYKE